MTARRAHCDYLDGKPARTGSGTRLVTCVAPPRFAVHVHGLSPLHVCRAHRDRLRLQFVTLEPHDVVVTDWTDVTDAALTEDETRTRESA